MKFYLKILIFIVLIFGVAYLVDDKYRYVSENYFTLNTENSNFYNTELDRRIEDESHIEENHTETTSLILEEEECLNGDSAKLHVMEKEDTSKISRRRSETISIDTSSILPEIIKNKNILIEQQKLLDSLLRKK
jgi:hypothetical protein